MFCHKCGSQLPEGSEFCPKCGAKQAASDSMPQAAKEPISTPVQETQVLYQPPPTGSVTPPKAKSKKKPIIIGSIAGVVLLFILIGVFSQDDSGSPANAPTQSAQATSPTATPTPTDEPAATDIPVSQPPVEAVTLDFIAITGMWANDVNDYVYIFYANFNGIRGDNEHTEFFEWRIESDNIITIKPGMGLSERWGFELDTNSLVFTNDETPDYIYPFTRMGEAPEPIDMTRSNIGDTFRLGDWEITLLSYSIDEPSEYVVTAEDDTIFSVELSVVNMGTSRETFIPIDWSLLYDKVYTFNQTYSGLDNRPQINRPVNPLGSDMGYISFIMVNEIRTKKPPGIRCMVE